MKYKIQIKVLSATIPDVIHNAPYICGGCRTRSQLNLRLISQNY